jgi:hypothetical protein
MVRSPICDERLFGISSVTLFAEGTVRTQIRNGAIEKRQLETWLVGSYERPVAAASIGELLGIDEEFVPAVRRRSMRFVVAVLRDMFSDDCQVKAWLSQVRSELGNTSASESLLTGSTEAVEALAVDDWNAFAENK